MKKPERLKLLAVGDKLINDYDAAIAGTCRYIGRRWDANLKGWPATSEPSSVRPLPEYVMHVQHGDIHAADEETARYCGVTFEKPADTKVAAVNQVPFTGKF